MTKTLLQIFILLFFVFSVGFDFEYVITTIRGEGEVLGQSSTLVGDKFEKVTNLSIPLKLMDGLTFLLLVIFLTKPKKNIDIIKESTRKDELYGLLLTVFGFILWGATTIYANAQEYSAAQVLVMTLHLVKLFQVMFTGIMLALVLRDCDIKIISNSLLFGFIVVCGVLFLNSTGRINIGALAGDRMETFGVILVVIAIIYKLYSHEEFFNKITAAKKILYGCLIFIGTIAILNSGKRGVMLAFICCIPFLFVNIKSKGKWRISVLHYALVASVLICMPVMMSAYNRTLGNSYDGVLGTVYKEDIYLGVEKVTGKTNSQLKEVGVPVISNLDYSGAERFGKYLKAISLIPENIWTGSGFWGVQFKYKFLPDSALVLILEMGLIGTFLVFMILYHAWRIACVSKKKSNGVLVLNNTVTVLVAFAVLSIFSNPWYMSRLMMVWMFFITFSLFMTFSDFKATTSIKNAKDTYL